MSSSLKRQVPAEKNGTIIQELKTRKKVLSAGAVPQYCKEQQLMRVLWKMGAKSICVFFWLVCSVCLVFGEKLPPPCDSDIYCYGDLLHTIQMASIFHDSKTFVDMKMKQPPNETWELFNKMITKTGGKPNGTDIKEFVVEAFDPEGSEFEDWEPSDWVEHPKFLDRISDVEFRDWGNKLNALWKFLGRKMKDHVRDHQELYSIIYVPHPVIVPGGRFREFYYWDSYWIVRGLLLSEMHTTVKGMLGNFLSIVEHYGFIPNGGRVYYAMRSQPPLLIPMVKSYLDETKDFEFLRENIDTLDKEFQYWMTNHTVYVEKNGIKYQLAKYGDTSSGPRPESYREDYMSALAFRTAEEREGYYSELKAAAESGWDFSSRWFILNATNKGNLTNLKSRSIIPVDLNAILYWNAKLLAEFYKDLNMHEKSVQYSEIGDTWMEAVTQVLWHEEVGAWLDYDILNEIKRDYFYPTNISPLWTGCYNVHQREIIVAKVMKYLDKTRIMVNMGGIPTTTVHSGEQWDYPNAWPPLQYIMIMGLDNTGDPWAKRLAFEIAERWVRSNFKAFNETNAMYEKYDATVVGGHGGGGEYETQLGFGWSNGVIMELLDKYGDALTADDEFLQPERLSNGVKLASSSLGSVITAILVLVATLAAGFIGMVVYKKHAVHAISSDKRVLCPKLCGGYMELKDMTFD